MTCIGSQTAGRRSSITSATAHWRARPVFVTSTFVDMQVERDYLRQAPPARCARSRFSRGSPSRRAATRHSARPAAQNARQIPATRGRRPGLLAGLPEREALRREEKNRPTTRRWNWIGMSSYGPSSPIRAAVSRVYSGAIPTESQPASY